MKLDQGITTSNQIIDYEFKTMLKTLLKAFVSH